MNTITINSNNIKDSEIALYATGRVLDIQYNNLYIIIILDNSMNGIDAIRVEWKSQGKCKALNQALAKLKILIQTTNLNNI